MNHWCRDDALVKSHENPSSFLRWGKVACLKPQQVTVSKDESLGDTPAMQPSSWWIGLRESLQETIDVHRFSHEIRGFPVDFRLKHLKWINYNQLITPNRLPLKWRTSLSMPMKNRHVYLWHEQCPHGLLILSKTNGDPNWCTKGSTNGSYVFLLNRPIFQGKK